METIIIKDSVIQDKIDRGMKLQRLYGKRDAIEAHLDLFNEDSTIRQTLQKSLDQINHEIMMFQSDE